MAPIVMLLQLPVWRDGIQNTSWQMSEGLTLFTAPPPSLLIIVLDTNPISWMSLSPALDLSAVLTTLLIYINAHLAINHENRVAVLASHVDHATWLYPTPEADAAKSSQTNGHTPNGARAGNSNKYQPFAIVEEELKRNLDQLLENTETTEESLSLPPRLSGALSIALTYANMQTMLSGPPAVETAATSSGGIPGAADLDAHTSATRGGASGQQLVTRILVVSVSDADLSSQYISLMNSVFAAQRLQIPIDILRIGERTAFLQQASDATSGVFMNYVPPNNAAANGSAEGQDGSNSAAAGLLQTLMMAYLPDTTARKILIMPGSAEVDFRAACFCHGKIVDLGGVCSICLSIFCLPLETDHCPTCRSQLKIPKSVTTKPVVVPRLKKKKSKKPKFGDPATPGASTPVHSGTPV
jgi:transcription initiation factor TFIIH subunit 3